MNFQTRVDEEVKFEIGNEGKGCNGREGGQRGHHKHKVTSFLANFQLSDFRKHEVDFFNLQDGEDGLEDVGGRRRKQGVVYLRQLSRSSISEMRM